jgi:phosphotriesterase-related protein
MEIQTVRGLVPAANVGHVDAHSHIWIGRGVSGAPVLADEEAARAELEDFNSTGGSLVIDCQPGDIGRDGRVLGRLAGSTAVAIVASTGFHLERYYAPGSGPWAVSDDTALALFEQELREGLKEAPEARAGVIKSAWTGRGGRGEALIRVCLQAARRSDVGMVVHTERGADVEMLVRLVEEHSVSPGRVQLSHVDKRPDHGLHRDLARAGYLLGYDTFLRPKYHPEEHVWPLLRFMIAEGLWKQVTLGLDLVDVRDWHVWGGCGLRAIPTVVLPRLRREGVSDEAVKDLGGGNAARLLGLKTEGARVKADSR